MRRQDKRFKPVPYLKCNIKSQNRNTSIRKKHFKINIPYATLEKKEE